MANIQEIFDRMQATKKEQRELKKVYRDSLANSASYQRVVEDLKALKEKKKDLEQAIKDDMRSEFDKLERLKVDLESDKELINDLALNQMLKGQAIDIKDQHENQYEPIFSVKFKKIG